MGLLEHHLTLDDPFSVRRRPQESRCEVWFPSLMGTPQPAWVATLEDAERERAQRFRSVELRQRWLLAHAWQRQLLGHYLSTPPQDLRLVRNGHGKPTIAAPPHAEPHNLSHSSAYAALAVAPHGQVGLDIEAVDTAVTGARGPIAEVLSAHEHRWVHEQPSPHHAFLRLWTRKEAVVKCLGIGIPENLSAIDVLSAGHQSSDPIATPWSSSVMVWDLPAPAGYLAALALSARPASIHVYQFLSAPYNASAL